MERHAPSLAVPAVSRVEHHTLMVVFERFDGDGVGAAPTTCPVCQASNVGSFCVTSLVVYLRCADCRHIWNIPERRQLTRATDQHKRF